MSLESGVEPEIDEDDVTVFFFAELDDYYIFGYGNVGTEITDKVEVIPKFDCDAWL